MIDPAVSFQFDLAHFAKQARAAETPAMREAQARYERAHEAGMAGLPMPADADSGAYLRAVIERRARAGEVIAVVMGGCKCLKCSHVDWGYRLGCRCWGHDDLLGNGPGMSYGALVFPESPDQREPLRFVSRDELLVLRAAGKEVLDSDTGEPVAIEA